MKTTRKIDDGLEWLRELRRKIAADCGHDLARQSEAYRKAAAGITYNVYQGEKPVVRTKKKRTADLVHA